MPQETINPTHTFGFKATFIPSVCSAITGIATAVAAHHQLDTENIFYLATYSLALQAGVRHLTWGSVYALMNIRRYTGSKVSEFFRKTVQDITIIGGAGKIAHLGFWAPTTLTLDMLLLSQNVQPEYAALGSSTATAIPYAIFIGYLGTKTQQIDDIVQKIDSKGI